MAKLDAKLDLDSLNIEELAALRDKVIEKLAEKVAQRHAELEAEMERLSQYGKSPKKSPAAAPAAKAKKRDEKKSDEASGEVTDAGRRRGLILRGRLGDGRGLRAEGLDSLSTIQQPGGMEVAIRMAVL